MAVALKIDAAAVYERWPVELVEAVMDRIRGGPDLTFDQLFSQGEAS